MLLYLVLEKNFYGNHAARGRATCKFINKLLLYDLLVLTVLL